METVDVAIVGAGPAGLMAASEAALAGASVMVFEEHGEVGVPPHCAGLIGVRGMERLGLDPQGDYVQNRVRGARFKSPGGLELVVDSKEHRACVVDRVALDKALGELAISHGAKVIPRSRARNLARRGGRILGLSTRRGNVRSMVVIDCEGAGASLLSDAGLPKPKGALPAAQFEVIVPWLDEEYVEVHTGSKLAPGFFAYVVPVAERKARVGLASKGGPPRTLLTEFLKHRFGQVKVVSQQGGTLLTGGPIAKTYAPGFLVAGDAAGQSKPTTGGGVVTGGICARIAGRVAAEAAAASDPSQRTLATYERLWRRELGREFSLMGLARFVLNVLPDRAVDEVFKVFSEGRLLGLLRRADVDGQGELVEKLTRRRAFISVVLAALRGVALGT